VHARLGVYWPPVTSTDTHPGRAAWDVVGLGANSVDYVNLLPAYPQPQGEFAKMRIREQTITCGGQMATALATCSQLGLSAKYLGATGTDDNGRRIRLEMERRGIDLADAVIRDGRTQFAIILVDEGTGERIVLWDRGRSAWLCAIARCLRTSSPPPGSCTWTTWTRRRPSRRRASHGSWGAR